MNATDVKSKPFYAFGAGGAQDLSSFEEALESGMLLKNVKQVSITTEHYDFQGRLASMINRACPNLQVARALQSRVGICIQGVKANWHLQDSAMHVTMHLCDYGTLSVVSSSC